MCVIVDLPKGITLSYSSLEVCYDNNPHGWGIMAVIGGKMVVEKKLSDFNSFKAAWRQFPANVERAIHFRWATHGDRNDDNCHPFEVTPDLYMMHNGIIRTVEIDNKMSDTWHFAKHDLGDPNIINSWGADAVTREDFKKMIEDCTTGSRLLFMDTQGRVMRTSTWSKRYGAFFSNSLNFDKKWKGNSVSPSWRSGGWGEYSGEDYSYGGGGFGNGRGREHYAPLQTSRNEPPAQRGFSDLLPYGQTIESNESQDYTPKHTEDGAPLYTLEELEVMEPNDICDFVMDNPWEATDLIMELLGRNSAFPGIRRTA